MRSSFNVRVALGTLILRRLLQFDYNSRRYPPSRSGINPVLLRPGHFLRFSIDTGQNSLSVSKVIWQPEKDRKARDWRRRREWMSWLAEISIRVTRAVHSTDNTFNIGVSVKSSPQQLTMNSFWRRGRDDPNSSRGSLNIGTVPWGWRPLQRSDSKFGNDLRKKGS